MSKVIKYSRARQICAGPACQQLKLVRALAKELAWVNARAIVVGGFTRDLVRAEYGARVSPKDIDVEIFGIAESDLLKMLSRYGAVNKVGRSFAVLKVNGVDFSFPRKDRKIASGHRGFLIKVDPEMSYPEAARRRDFTVNSLGWNPLTGELFDPYGGVSDLRARLLKVVDAETFVEDPLRVLRAMQFAARFDLKIESKTLELCKSIDLSDLSQERITDELTKGLVLAEQPSVTLDWGVKLKIWDKLFPELNLNDQTKLAPIYKTIDQTEPVLHLVLASLLSFYERPAIDRFLSRLQISKPEKQIIKKLSLHQSKVPALVEKSDYLQLANQIRPANLKDLIKVSLTRSDFDDRAIIREAKRLKVLTTPAKPFIKGKDLVRFGYTSGPKMGEVLDQLYQKQIAGEITSRRQALKLIQEPKPRKQ